MLPVCNSSSVRVQKQFISVETISLLRQIGAVDPVGVELSQAHASDPDVPYVTGAVRGWVQFDDAVGPDVLCPRVEFQRDPVGVSAEQGKVDASVTGMGTERQRRTSLYLRRPAGRPVLLRVLWRISLRLRHEFFFVASARTTEVNPYLCSQ
jgi:hypothetical protein